MRAAPPVRVVVPHSGAWRWFVVALVASAAACLVGWALAWLDVARIGLVAGLAAVAAGGAAYRFADVDAGDLSWDGTQWTWRERPGDVTPAIDLGRWMLLRFDGQAPRRRAWLAVDADAAGAGWHALRAAVYCRGSLSKPE